MPTDSSNNIVILADHTAETMAHELGHYFGLFHTFQGYNSNPSNNKQIVNNPASGDGMDDTPADAGIPPCLSNNCLHPCDNVYDPNNTQYMPDIKNVMSYYNCYPQHFSEKQAGFMWMTLNNNSYRNFLLSATPICAPIYSNVGEIDRACSQVSLNLQDPMGPVLVDIKNITTNSNTCTRFTGSIGYASVGKYNPYPCGLFFCGDNISVKLAPQKNGGASTYFYNPLNGVSTYDLQLIQKHILGIQALERPYRWIAADANNNGSITTFDIITIQKVILGMSTNFDIGSWRFVPRYYLESQQNFYNDFVDFPFSATWQSPDGSMRVYKPTPSDPPGTKSFMDEANFNLQDINVSKPETWSFYGVKVGDVNCDAMLTLDPFYGTGGGDLQNYRFIVDSHECFESGSYALITIKGQSLEQIESYQMGVKFDPAVMTILGVAAGDFPSFDISNFGLSKTANGEMRNLWFDPTTTTPVDLSSPKSLYKLYVKFLRPVCRLGDIFALNDTILKSAFYGESENTVPIALTVSVESKNPKHSLASINPNPFNNTTTFNFNLGENAHVMIRLSDGYGNTKVFEDNYPMGSNSKIINDLSTLQEGIVFYNLILGSEVYSGTLLKM